MVRWNSYKVHFVGSIPTISITLEEIGYSVNHKKHIFPCGFYSTMESILACEARDLSSILNKSLGGNQGMGNSPLDGTTDILP